MYCIGLDIGGTNCKLAFVKDGDLYFKQNIISDSDIGLKPLLSKIVNTINTILNTNSIDKNEIKGVHISMPGIVDTDKCKLLLINDKFNDAYAIDFNEWARTNWNAKLTMDNDARSACVGEWKYGAGKGTDNLVMVTLGTGFGTSAIINGDVLRGSDYTAGILGGHIIANAEGFKCNCGSIGCVEAHSSTWNLLNIAKSIEGFESSDYNRSTQLNFKNIFDLSNSGDEFSIKLRNYCLNYWTVGIANLIYAYSPQKVVIGGGVMKSSDTILPYIKERLKTFGWHDFSKIDILKAQNPDNAAVLSSEYFLCNT